MARPEDKECTCESEYHDLHTCPFKVEINDDCITLCDCCEYCRGECAGDV